MSVLDNKIALVTGASRGIGAAIARRLAKEGATVALSYNSSADAAQAVADEITAAGGTAATFRGDASSTDGPAALIAAVADRFGGIDIPVNNAGVYATGALAETDRSVIDDNWAVNVRGVYETTRAAVPHLRANGRVVNIGSITALTPFPGGSAYAASKAAVAALSKSWAKELAGNGITVNTIHPGSVDTQMNPASGEFAEMQKGMNLFGRFGRPEEIAHAVAFLTHPDSSFITGVELAVDGGLTA